MGKSKGEIGAAAFVKGEFFKNPVAFALNALLIPGFTNMTVRTNGGLCKFALVAEDNYTAKRFHGDPIPVYMIVDGTGYGKGAFDGYWCPFDLNSVKRTTVWKKGNAMFTDRMDGCTFGVGVPSGDGAITVAHVNQNRYERRDDRSMMEDTQRFLTQKAVGSGGSILEPSGYRRKPGEDSGLSSTTFGVRDPKTNTWTFYAQIMEGMGGDYILRSVKKI